MKIMDIDRLKPLGGRSAMDSLKGKSFVVTSATGRQGSAIVLHLLTEGAIVKALTRDPNSKKAKQLMALGAKLVTGDMAKPDALITLFQGAAGIYSVQNPCASSIAAEIQQGKNVADAAKAASVAHIAQGSAGIGKKTGFPS